MNATPNAPRSYLVGLPVVITVHDSGRVEVDAALEEAADAIREEYPSEHSDYLDEATGQYVQHTEADVTADAQRVTEYHDRRSATAATQTDPRTLPDTDDAYYGVTVVEPSQFADAEVIITTHVGPYAEPETSAAATVKRADLVQALLPAEVREYLTDLLRVDGGENGAPGAYAAALALLS